jgi:hypothetical protein
LSSCGLFEAFSGFFGLVQGHKLNVKSLMFDQLNPDAPVAGGRIPLEQCPDFAERVFIFNSARAVFYAPSDVSGVGGMHHERIRATKSWYLGLGAIAGAWQYSSGLRPLNFVAEYVQN